MRASEIIMGKNEELTIDDFKVVKLLGKGAFAKVYLAQLSCQNVEDNGKYYAIKSVKKPTLIKKNMISGALVEK